MSPFKHWTLQSLVAALAATALSCGGGVTESDAADEADQSTEATSVESALTAELGDEVAQPATADANALAASAATRVKTRFTPSTCVTTAVDQAKVTYTLNDCTGPYGLVHATGTLTAVYSRASAGAVRVAINATALKVNNATIDVNATVVASQVGNTKTMEVTSNSKGTGPRGLSVARQGTFTTVFDSTTQCLTLDGSWQSTVGVRKSTTVVTNYGRCRGKCPKKDSRVVHTATAKGSVALTVDYDGTAVAKWSTSGGRSGTVNLSCTAN